MEKIAHLKSQTKPLRSASFWQNLLLAHFKSLALYFQFELLLDLTSRPSCSFTIMAWLKNRSKFHNTASSVSKDLTYPDLRPSPAEHSQGIAVSGKFIAVAWAARGGAQIGILKHEESGKRGYANCLCLCNKFSLID